MRSSKQFHRMHQGFFTGRTLLPPSVPLTAVLSGTRKAAGSR